MHTGHVLPEIQTVYKHSMLGLITHYKSPWKTRSLHESVLSGGHRGMHGQAGAHLGVKDNVADSIRPGETSPRGLTGGGKMLWCSYA